ncbi:hypothetical protein FACS18949_08720 [Clostridia bacterium]|nr:hypothetical protein FACS18949_08720 [Clostridia bacterium]
MKNSKTRKILSLVVALAMVLSFVPAALATVSNEITIETSYTIAAPVSGDVNGVTATNGLLKAVEDEIVVASAATIASIDTATSDVDDATTAFKANDTIAVKVTITADASYGFVGSSNGTAPTISGATVSAPAIVGTDDADENALSFVITWTIADDTSDTTAWTPGFGAAPTIADDGKVPFSGDVSLSGTAALYVDLVAGKLVNDNGAGGATVVKFFDAKGYSLDGGTKWKKGYPADKDIEKLIKKGGVLKLTDKANNKGEPFVPEADATGDAAIAGNEVTFDEIAETPAKLKLVADYSGGADAAGGPGTWTVRDKNEEAMYDTANLQVAYSANGKVASKFDADQTAIWMGFNAGELKVAPTAATAKPASKVYLVRTAPTKDGDKYVPASPITKIKVSDQIKAPKLKPDYKKEVIKNKKDTYVWIGTNTSINVAGNPTATAGTDKVTFSVNGNFFITSDKDEAKKPLDISNALTNKYAVKVWVGPTAKKPSSVIQVITLAPRADTPVGVSVAGNKGKASVAKTYEFLKEPGKWSGFKAPTSTTTVEEGARVKNTAKANNTALGYVGAAASIPVNYTVTVGVYETKNDGSTKEGVLSVFIGAPKTIAATDIKAGTPKAIAISDAFSAVAIANLPKIDGTTAAITEALANSDANTDTVFTASGVYAIKITYTVTGNAELDALEVSNFTTAITDALTGTGNKATLSIKSGGVTVADDEKSVAVTYTITIEAT